MTSVPYLHEREDDNLRKDDNDASFGLSREVRPLVVRALSVRHNGVLRESHHVAIIIRQRDHHKISYQKRNLYIIY